jgi:hypothetical protein
MPIYNYNKLILKMITELIGPDLKLPAFEELPPSFGGQKYRFPEIRLGDKTK